MVRERFVASAFLGPLVLIMCVIESITTFLRSPLMLPSPISKKRIGKSRMINLFTSQVRADMLSEHYGYTPTREEIQSFLKKLPMRVYPSTMLG
jgi:hypothetical protein